MAALTLNMVDQMTALEVVKRANNPDAFLIIEALLQTNELLTDMPVLQANDGAIHTTLRRMTQPGGQHRIYNQGVEVKASQTKTIHDRITMLEAYAVVDKKLAEHGGDVAALRHSEAVAFLNGMGIDQARDLIYGDWTKNPAEIDGLATRLSALGKNVISMGGTGANLTSLYILAAGPQFCHLIYPRGSSSIGVSRQDLGEQTWKDDEGNPFQAYVDHFEANYGLVIRHPDAVKRLCNIPADVDPTTLVDTILAQLRRLPKGATNRVIYANASILNILDKAARDRPNVIYPTTDPWGKPLTMVRDARLRQVDAILEFAEIAVA
ncbi:MAG: hypothetical protein LBU28_07015 [Spirochaetaceae bacterium]|jgi:hypothetical protein|nr:hypothetical protein [Spirochaetaceae bacterium]